MQLALGVQPVPFVPPPAPASASLERAFEEHHAMVFRTAYRITGNAADAEDVMQSVFLRILRRENAADPVENEESYFRRSAVNAALNVVQERARKNLPLENAPEPHARTDQRDLREVLRLALAKLQGRAAEMFALRFLEGYSNGEIAEMFRVSALVVGVTLHRARKQLQKEVRILGGLK